MRKLWYLFLCSSLVLSNENKDEIEPAFEDPVRNFTVNITEIHTTSIVYLDGKVYYNDISIKCFCGQYATHVTITDGKVTGYCDYHLAHLHRSDKNSPHRDMQ